MNCVNSVQNSIIKHFDSQAIFNKTTQKAKMFLVKIDLVLQRKLTGTGFT